MILCKVLLPLLKIFSPKFHHMLIKILSMIYQWMSSISWCFALHINSVFVHLSQSDLYRESFKILCRYAKKKYTQPHKFERRLPVRFPHLQRWKIKIKYDYSMLSFPYCFQKSEIHMFNHTVNEHFSDGEGHIKVISTLNWEFRNSLKAYILIVKQNMNFLWRSVWLSRSESRGCDYIVRYYKFWSLSTCRQKCIFFNYF